MPKKSLFFVQKPLRWLFVTFLFGTLFCLGTMTAFAALDTYTVAGDPGSLPATGAATLALGTITITEDGAADDFLAGTETIQVKIIGAYGATTAGPVVWDQTVTTLTIAGSCNYTGHNALVWVDTVTVNIPVTGGSCGAGGIITIAGLKLDTKYAIGAPGAQALYSVDNTTTSSGGAISPVGVNYSISATPAGATLTLGDNSVVGATGFTTFTFTLSENLYASTSDQVAFEVPANLDPSGLVAAATHNFGGEGTLSCTASTRLITCVVATNQLTARSGGQIVMSGIKSKYAATDQTLSNSSVAATRIGKGNVNSDATGGAVTPNTTASTSTTGYSASSAGDVEVVGDITGAFSVALSLPIALAQNDTIKIALPANWTISGTPTASGLDGAVTVTKSDQILTVTLTGAAQTTLVDTIVFQSDTIYSAYVGTGSATILIEKAATGADVVSASTDTGISVTTTATTVGSLSSTNVEPAILTNRTYSSATVTFITTKTIDNSGVIKVTFPSGYVLSGVSTATASAGVSGTLTPSVSGQVVSVTVGTGAAATPSSPLTVTFILYNVLTPESTGSSATYTIATYQAGGLNLLQQNSSVTGDTIYSRSDVSSPTIGIPSSFEAVENPDGNGILITWSDPSDDSTYIQIFRGVDPYPVNGTAYASVAKGIEEFIDADVSRGDTVTYMLRATEGTVFGSYTDEVTIAVTASNEDTSDDATGDDTTVDEDTTGDTTDEIITDEETGETTTVEEVLAAFSDTADIPSWAENAIATLVYEGVLEGNADGTFAPADYLNRAEAAAMLWRVLLAGGTEDSTWDSAESGPFSDVLDSAWYGHYVEGLKALDIVTGNPDGTYQPAESMNRAEFVVLALRAYIYLNPSQAANIEALQAGAVTTAYADLDASAWYADEVTAATEYGFVSGSACVGSEGMCFNAEDNINRAEAAKVLDSMF